MMLTSASRTAKELWLHAKLPSICQISVLHNVRSWWLMEPFPHPRQANDNSYDNSFECEGTRSGLYMEYMDELPL